MSQATYLALSQGPSQASQDFNNEIPNYDVYSETIRLLQDYPQYPWDSEEELQFLASVSRDDRKRLYALFFAVAEYLDNRLLQYEIAADESGDRQLRQAWSLGDDGRNHVAMAMTMLWPDSYTLVDSPTLQPLRYLNDNYPWLGNPDMAELEIRDYQSMHRTADVAAASSRKRSRMDPGFDY